MIQCSLVALLSYYLYFVGIVYLVVCILLFSMFCILILLIISKLELTFHLNENFVLALAFNAITLTFQKDMREPPSHSGYTWSVTAGVKSLAWNPYCGFYFVVRYGYFSKA
jgi:hypothetical protein